MPPLTKLPIVVVYKESKRKNAKKKIKVFENTIVDEIINERKRKPLLPEGSEIVELGIGKSFEKTYKEKYKL
jgi:hypothetical protein